MRNETRSRQNTDAAASAPAPVLVFTPPRIREHLDRVCDKSRRKAASGQSGTLVEAPKPPRDETEQKRTPKSGPENGGRSPSAQTGSKRSGKTSAWSSRASRAAPMPFTRRLRPLLRRRPAESRLRASTQDLPPAECPRQWSTTPASRPDESGGYNVFLTAAKWAGARTSPTPKRHLARHGPADADNGKRGPSRRLGHTPKAIRKATRSDQSPKPSKPARASSRRPSSCRRFLRPGELCGRRTVPAGAPIWHIAGRSTRRSDPGRSRARGLA